MVFSIFDDIDSMMFPIIPRGHNHPSPMYLTRVAAPATRNALSCNLDVSEGPDSYVIKAELPGIPKEKVQIHLENQILTLEGSTGEEHEHERDQEESAAAGGDRYDGEKEGVKYHIRERSWGSFKRSIKLPKGIDQDNIKASMEHGVLEISIAKKEKEEKKKLAINIQ